MSDATLIREVKGYRKVFVFKKPRVLGVKTDKKDQKRILDNKIIANFQIIISGSTGCGKTTTLLKVTEKVKETSGATVIILSERVGGEFENANVMFEPEDEEHLEWLERYGRKPKAQPVKIYHPFTFNLKVPEKSGLTPPYKRKQFPINFFTIPLRKLSGDELKILFRGKDEDKVAVDTAKGILRTLRPDEDLRDFLMKIFKKRAKGSGDFVVKYSMRENWGFPEVSEISKPIKGSIIKDCVGFRVNYFVQEETCPYNLDLLRVLNDTKHYHIFSTKWLPYRRHKYFLLVYLLKQIDNLMSKDLVNQKVILMIEELKDMLPNSEQEHYEKTTVGVFKPLLSQIRAKGRYGAITLANTQDFYQTDDKYTSACDVHMIMNSSGKEIENYAKRRTWAKSIQDRISGLQRGEFIFAGHPRIMNRKYLCHLPCHDISREGVDFLSRYKEHALKNNLELKDAVEVFEYFKRKLKKGDADMKIFIRNMVKEEKERRIKEKESRDRKDDSKLDEYKKKEKKKADEKTFELKKKAYELRQRVDRKGKLMSYSKIGREIGRSHHIAKKYIEDYEDIVKDTAVGE